MKSRKCEKVALREQADHARRAARSGCRRSRTSRSSRAEVPAAGPGEVLVRSLWLSLDPYMRGPDERGALLRQADADRRADDRAGRSARWSRAATRASLRATSSSASSAGRTTRSRAAARCGRSIPRSRRSQTALHVLGVDRPDGVLRALRRRASRSPATPSSSRRAAGAVGHIVGQLAKIAGCRPVVGIAGRPRRSPT